MRSEKPKPRKPKKAKYYLRKSWNWPDWYATCQVKNNVMVGEFSDLNIAELCLEYLNALPSSITRHVMVK